MYIPPAINMYNTKDPYTVTAMRLWELTCEVSSVFDCSYSTYSSTWKTAVFSVAIDEVVLFGVFLIILINVYYLDTLDSLYLWMRVTKMAILVTLTQHGLKEEGSHIFQML